MSFRLKRVMRKGRYNNADVIVASYGGRFSLRQAKNKVEEYQAELMRRGKKGKILVNMLLPNKEGEDARWFTVNSFTDMRFRIKWNLEPEGEEEEDYFNKYVQNIPRRFKGMQIVMALEEDGRVPATLGVSVLGHARRQMGDDEHNDCLYNCLKREIPEIMRFAFPTPIEFKNRLGLCRDDKVPIDKIPLVEARLPKYKIKVIGQHIYESSKSAPNTITLYINSEHVYNVRKPKKMDCFKGISEHERQPIVFYPDGEDRIKIYDGSTVKNKPFSWYKEQTKNPKKSPYVFIKATPANDIVDIYDEFIKDAELLKEKTNGKYNLYKTGKITKCVLNRFRELNPHLVADEISTTDAEWIVNASKSALMWCEEEYEGVGYEYDFVSKYPSILAKQRFSFPIKEGRFKIMTKSEFKQLKYYPYGIEQRLRLKTVDYSKRTKQDIIHIMI